MAVPQGNAVGANRERRSPQEEMEAFDRLGPYARHALASSMIEQSAYYLLAPGRIGPEHDHILAEVVENGDKYIVATSIPNFYYRPEGHPQVKPDWKNGAIRNGEIIRRFQKQQSTSDVIAEMRRARGQR